MRPHVARHSLSIRSRADQAHGTSAARSGFPGEEGRGGPGAELPWLLRKSWLPQWEGWFFGCPIGAAGPAGVSSCVPSLGRQSGVQESREEKGVDGSCGAFRKEH